ncbi:MAG: DUF3253 domain-containing protein [Verrucomicrobiaceae bacterium]
MPPPKTCQRCGRLIEWRKKWETNWDDIRYCSAQCRKNKLTPTDHQLEQTILALLQQIPRGKTICPSQATRQLFPEDQWRDQMEPTRQAARRLVAQQKIDILQKGKIVDPSTAKGPIRLRLK